jgi:RNA polymerase sigma-70 factor, ECF subfamily
MDEFKIKRLLIDIAAASEPAFCELYREFSRRVFAYAFNQLRDSGKAEEVVIDTMHDVWRNAATFRGDSLFSTWLIGIARNHVLMAFRTQDRREKPDLSDNVDDFAETLEDKQLSAFDVMVNNETSLQVMHCLNTLNPNQRESIHLVFYEGWSLSEVAAHTRTPEGTVKTRLHHARKKLGECLSGFQDGVVKVFRKDAKK